MCLRLAPISATVARLKTGEPEEVTSSRGLQGQGCAQGAAVESSALRCERQLTPRTALDAANGALYREAWSCSQLHWSLQSRHSDLYPVVPALSWWLVVAQ